MNRFSRYAGQAVAYALFAALVGYFATSPAYQRLGADQAMIKVSFAHSGKLVGECREISAMQRARLPPGARVPMDCPRERSDLKVEFDLDGVTVLSKVVRPTGLSRDGAAYVYESFVVASGQHALVLRMRDDIRTEGFDHVKEVEATLEPGRMLVVDFLAERGGFVLIR